MTPSPDDPLFRALIENYQRAGIRSVPVESTWERNLLASLDFNPQCEHTTAHKDGRDGHTGDPTAAYQITAPCGLHVYMCESAIDNIEENISRRSWCGTHSHPNTDLAITPLPEGNR